MDFLWTTINVKNMEESLKFYKELLKLEISRKFSPRPGVEIVFLGSGETKLELICNKNQETDFGNDISMGFKTDSLDCMIDLVKEKEIDVQGPFMPSENVKFFYIRDPNGMKIQIVEQS